MAARIPSEDLQMCVTQLMQCSTNLLTVRFSYLNTRMIRTSFRRRSMDLYNNERRFSMLIYVMHRRSHRITTQIWNPNGRSSVRSSFPFAFLFHDIHSRSQVEGWFHVNDNRTASKSLLSTTSGSSSDRTNEWLNYSVKSRIKHSS